MGTTDYLVKSWVFYWTPVGQIVDVSSAHQDTRGSSHMNTTIICNIKSSIHPSLLLHETFSITSELQKN